MKATKLQSSVLQLVFGILFIFGSVSLRADTPAEKPKKVLFIGNSITAPLPRLVKELAASSNPPAILTADNLTLSGAKLDVLWESADVQERILTGAYDIVVLQPTLGTFYGGMTADTEGDFHDYARRFANIIRQSGAKLLLFMQWQFDDAEAMSTEEISRLCNAVAAERGAQVAPVGFAFQQAQNRQKDIRLLIDSVHSNDTGSYLAACVLYATLFHSSPVGLSPLSTGLSIEEAGFLQDVAWKTVLDYLQPVKAQ